MFGPVARHVSWMAIPCPRAATGNDCPASPQGAPQKHTRKHTHISLAGRPAGCWRVWMIWLHDPKIAFVWPTAGCKTHLEICSTNVKHIETNTSSHPPGGPPCPYGVHHYQFVCPLSRMLSRETMMIDLFVRRAVAILFYISVLNCLCHRAQS